MTEAAWVELFNRGEYIAAVLELEKTWLVSRDDFHKALIRLCVGLNQVRLGLDSGPQFLLTSARSLLGPLGSQHGGLDLMALDAVIERALKLLDEQPGQPRELPPLRLELRR